MLIIQDNCTGCGICLPYCPMGAISMMDNDEYARIDDECVDCQSCIRLVRCPGDAFEYIPAEWPKSLSEEFSNPISDCKRTGIPGRGTEEMKTNDVTDRFKKDEIGYVVELGRPNFGARFSDVEIVTNAVAKKGVLFEAENPITFLMADQKTGKLPYDIKDVKILSAVVEFKSKRNRMIHILSALKEACKGIKTVASVSILGVVNEDLSLPFVDKLDEAGIHWRRNGKTNIGLGRALK